MRHDLSGWIVDDQTADKERIGECWYHINRWKTMNMHVFLCFTEICIPFLVLEGLHPRVYILIKWIRLYRRMKRERIEIGEYRFWVSHLLCSVCLSCAEYTHIVYVYVRLFARIIFFSWLHHAWSLSIWCATKPCPYRVRSSIVCHPPSSYNGLHRRIHILVLVSSIRFRHETNTNRSSLHF